MKKKIIILIASLVTLIILAGLVFGTGIIVKTDNQDFKQDPEFYKALGNHFTEQGEYENAAVAYETCLLLGEDLDVRNNLAVIYYKQARYTQAIYQLRKLIILEPDNPGYHYDLAINLVDRFRNTEEQNINDLEEALAEYERVEELEPGFAHAKENIGVLRRILKK